MELSIIYNVQIWFRNYNLFYFQKLDDTLLLKKSLELTNVEKF
jgi:hypothetical protein